MKKIALAICSWLLLSPCAHSAVSENVETTDAALSAALIGCWADEGGLEGVTVQGVTCYRGDGSAEMNAEARSGNRQIRINVKGTWKISNKKLIMTVTESSPPGTTPPGTTTTDDVISISADRMVILTQGGAKYISVKVEEPKGK